MLVRWKIWCPSSVARRPGGIANVVAECSTIAGPSIELPAWIDSSWKISVSTELAGA